MKLIILVSLLATLGLLVIFPRSIDKTYYVSVVGNDSSGDGTEDNPWRTVHYALTKVKENETLELSEGIFSEESLSVPPGVNIRGQGKTRTIIKANPSFYYNPVKPEFAPERFLIQFNSDAYVSGNQVIRDLMIDGDSKRLHGGIYVNKRSELVITNVLIQDTNFTGLWLWDTRNTTVRDLELRNCSWGSFEWCNAALNIGNAQNVEIENCSIDENTGYGIKSIGPKDFKISNLVIHHSRISVNPNGLWKDGLAPNISIELSDIQNSEIHHCYLDNHISIAGIDSSEEKSIRIHHNTIDLDNRAKGNGYGVELSVNNAEVDHNYFIKGSYGIVNWGAPKQNWEIHHNIFYGLESVYPTDVVRSQTSGLKHIRIYNNTIELIADKTVNFVGLYGGKGKDISIMNNLVINAENTSLNEVVHLENGASLDGLQVSHNFFENLPVDKMTETNLMDNSGPYGMIRSGNKPMPYYQLKKGSKLIDAGRDVGHAFEGKFPDVGAYEFRN